MTTHHHPFRGILAGIFLGLGFALATIIYGITTLGAITPWVALGVGLLIGILFIWIPSIRKGRRKPPQGYYAPQR